MSEAEGYLNEAQSPEGEINLSEMLDSLFHFITRRRWWILLPTCATALITIAALSRLPNRYSSEATLVVVEQKIPERYVTPTTTTDIGEELQAIQEEVLSRTRLLSIIEEFGLYPRERKRLAPEEVMGRMRQNISITPIETNSVKRGINAFKISFTTDNPRLAQEVTSRLTSLFIQENVKTREEQANTTTNFLRVELGAAKAKLAEQEQRLGAYKMGNIGQLPEQQQGNLQILAGLQGQLQNTTAGLIRAQQQQLYLQSLVRSDLARLQSDRETLLKLYTPKHPQVLKIDQEIATKQALLEMRGLPRSSDTKTAAAPTGISDANQRQLSIDPLVSQLEANRQEMSMLSSDEKRVKAEIAEYQQRLNRTPIREQELTGMLRDYEVLKKNYEDLLNKEQQSQLAMSLEKQQEGQQFRLVDPPSLPMVPSSPKRLVISLGGLAGGFGLGLALAFLLEIKDHSFRMEKDLKKRFSVPLVLGIPLMPTPREQRRRAWKIAYECVAGALLAVAVIAAEFFVYRRG